MQPKFLIVLRHGHGEHLINRVFSSLLQTEGGVDHHLTEKGRTEVAKTAEELVKRGFTRDTVKLMLVSPLNRTKETAQILVDHAVCASNALQIEEKIREQKMHCLEGLERDSLEGINACANWMEELHFLHQRGAEPFQDFVDRVYSALQSLESIDGHIIFVTHGAVVSAISHLYGDLSPVKTAEARVFPFPKE